MAASREDISNWFDFGVKEGATHMIVVCDTFDWEDYPVYVMPNEEVFTKKEKYTKDMQRVMEVYNLNMDKTEQLSATRVFNY